MATVEEFSSKGEERVAVAGVRGHREGFYNEKDLSLVTSDKMLMIRIRKRGRS